MMSNDETLANKQWRHLDTGQTGYDFSCGEYWVRCIHCKQAVVIKNGHFACSHCALVLQNDEEASYWFGACEVYADGRCYHCGIKYRIRENYPHIIGNTRKFNKNKTIACQACGRDQQVILGLIKTYRQGFDGYFGMPLLLTSNFKSHLFWAYNDKHLAELKQFIGATLRERNHSSGNSSMASRLPLWIKSAKNRDKLLTLIKKLEQVENPNEI